MRAFIGAVLCGAVSAVAVPQPDPPQLLPNLVASEAPTEAPNSVIPVFVTRTFPLLSPESALSSLKSKASATPTAVSLMPGITLAPELMAKVEQVVDDVKDSFLGLNIESPNKAAQPQKEAVNAAAVPASKNANTGSAKAKGQTAAAAATTCTNPSVRYQWGNLTDAHKTQYVNSIKCLMTSPAKAGFANAKTRWDDLTIVHQQMTPSIHNVGQFLGWHRYFLWIFQKMLSSECGYSGPLPWWDETLDAGNFNGAKPFTSQYEGHMPDGWVTCIISGVFANTNLNIGPGGADTTHCLSRGVNETTSSAINSGFVNTCLSFNNFEDFNNCLFFGPHAYGHDAIGGVMSDVQSSPGDPAFFLHHAFVDRVYRIWQRTNPSARTYALGGFTTQNCGNNCQPTTLNYVLSSMNLAQSVTLNQVMDTQGPLLCYHYDY